VQALDPAGDRAPVREQSAEPAVVDVGHLHAGGVLGDGVLALLLRSHEQHRAASARQVLREVVRLLDQLQRLLEIDDVDPAALGEDEALHLRVPAARLVTEMDSGLQELSHAYDRHSAAPFTVDGSNTAGGGADGTGPTGPAPPPVRPPGREQEPPF
jgi:hypothetical protein